MDSVYFYNTTLWDQYRSAKKIEILTLTKIDFSEEKCHEKRLNEQFWTSKFQNFLGGHAPTPP